MVGGNEDRDRKEEETTAEGGDGQGRDRTTKRVRGGGWDGGRKLPLVRELPVGERSFWETEN